jgi:hypothetical protein
MDAAQRLSGAGAERARQSAEAGFQAQEIADYLNGAASQLETNSSEAYRAIATTLRTLGAEPETNARNLEELETKLTALEEKMVAITRAETPDDVLFEIRRELEKELAPYRGKMTADQIVMLERRYLDTRLLERVGLPRLSLFYLH